MDRLWKRWSLSKSRFGDLMVIGFVLMQCLDGVFTYLGVRTWGLGIEANPIVSSAMRLIGDVGGLAAAKIVAIGLGMALHLRGVHDLIAVLTFIYFGVAILPWTALFLTH